MYETDSLVAIWYYRLIHAYLDFVVIYSWSQHQSCYNPVKTNTFQLL